MWEADEGRDVLVELRLKAYVVGYFCPFPYLSFPPAPFSLFRLAFLPCLTRISPSVTFGSRVQDLEDTMLYDTH